MASLAPFSGVARCIRFCTRSAETSSAIRRPAREGSPLASPSTKDPTNTGNALADSSSTLPDLGGTEAVNTRAKQASVAKPTNPWRRGEVRTSASCCGSSPCHFTSAANTYPRRGTVLMMRCSLSPSALRISTTSCTREFSVTTVEPQIAAIKASFLRTRPGLSTRYLRSNKALGESLTTVEPRRSWSWGRQIRARQRTLDHRDDWIPAPTAEEWKAPRPPFRAPCPNHIPAQVNRPSTCAYARSWWRQAPSPDHRSARLMRASILGTRIR